LLIQKKVVILQPLLRDAMWIVDALSHADKKAETKNQRQIVLKKHGKEE
jgi:hypothetical protein